MHFKKYYAIKQLMKIKLDNMSTLAASAAVFNLVSFIVIVGNTGAILDASGIVK